MILTKNDFKVGQEVAGKYAGNMERWNKGGYKLGTVSKVGNKLVTVKFSEDGKGVQFLFDDKYERDYLLQKSNYTGDYELFPSEQAYLDYNEKEDKLGDIRASVDIMRGGGRRLTVNQVRRIYDIISEEN